MSIKECTVYFDNEYANCDALENKLKELNYYKKIKKLEVLNINTGKLQARFRGATPFFKYTLDVYFKNFKSISVGVDETKTGLMIMFISLLASVAGLMAVNPILGAIPLFLASAYSFWIKKHIASTFASVVLGIGLNN